MKNISIIAFIGIFLFSCGGKNNVPVQDSPDSHQNSASLKETDLFNFDAVADFVESTNDKKIKKTAKQKFHTAIDIYRNKKKPEEAITVFKESLLMYPTAKTYYEYGNALLDSKKYEEATNAYHMAEKMNYSPLSKVLYNLACVYSLRENEEEALKYIQLAIENGYDNRSHMLKDSDLEFVRNSSKFNEVYETSYGGASTPEAALFDLFEMNFDKVELPYIITAENSQTLETGTSIAYDFDRFIPQMVNAEFSREVGDDFFYLANVASNERYVALIYAGSKVYTDYPPKYYYLTTYDPQKGKVIDQIMFAGMEYYGSELLEGKISSDMSIEVKAYEPEWKNDPETEGYDGNKITNKKLTATNNYRIDEKGNIIESRKLVGMK